MTFNNFDARVDADFFLPQERVEALKKIKERMEQQRVENRIKKAKERYLKKEESL